MRLYIPHGSDESLQYLRRRNIKYVLYIPHGSDESHRYLYKFSYYWQLYIPHGSDESKRWQWMWWRRYALYPTWFRWKVEMATARVYDAWLYIPHGSDERKLTLSIKLNCQKSFISHMVQMKAVVKINHISSLLTLYPTWFRWKFSWCHLWISFRALYIPHGSDESSRG